ncbi:MAG: nuclear transport factor 2 family protein [Chitinophagaceae bacterium]
MADKLKNKIIINVLFTVIFFSLVSLLSCKSHSKSFLPVAASTNDAETIKKLEYDWLIAEFKLDTATISKMMDGTFMSVGPGSISNKQQELDGMYRNISQRLKDNHIVDSLYLDDIHVQLYDNTAVIAFLTVTKGRINDVPFENRKMRFYDVWIKKNGQWKAVSSQGIPVP